MAAALIPVVGYDMHVERIGLPFVSFDIGPELGIPLTLLWITLVANLVNLIDGMDALAAGIVGDLGGRADRARDVVRPREPPRSRRSSAARRSASSGTTTTRRRSSWATAGR